MRIGTRPVGLGIAGIPATEEEKKQVRQATFLLRYRIHAESLGAAGAE